MRLPDTWEVPDEVPDEYKVARLRGMIAGDLYRVAEMLRAVQFSGALDREELTSNQRTIGAINGLADRLHRPPGRMPRDP